MEHFVKQLSAILPYKHKLNMNKIPSGDQMQEFMQEIILYGPMATLLDNSQLAPSSKRRPINDPSGRYIRELIAYTLIKFDIEYMVYDEKKIKEMIEIRNEKERTMVLDRLNRMSDEEKEVELITKNLRMGKWAIGGRIHALDGEIFDIEQQQRREMGISDFPGWVAGEYADPKGMAMDEYGNMLFSDEDMEREGGYDTNQHAYEDNE